MTTNQYKLSSRATALMAAILLLFAGRVGAQTYTLSPAPILEVRTLAGAIIANGCVWTYAAGTTTPIATYSDTTGVVNGNPIIAGSDGRFVAYLLPGTNYKYVYEATPCSAPSTHGTVLRTQDNIQGVPGSSNNVDIGGTAGEALSAGQCAYLSDGSGSKTQGQWYKCDSANTYSSTLPTIGIPIAAIASSTTGTFRIAGSITGLSSLTVGAPYYAGTSGAMTASAPANRRLLGTADSTTSLIVAANPALMTAAASGTASVETFLRGDQAWAAVFPQVAQGRLTLTTAAPVTVSDVTAATTLYYTPYAGNRLALYNGTNWKLTTFTELSIAVPATTSQMYDVFVYDNSGTDALELLAWTNDTTRATAVTLQDGVYVKSGTTTRRYLGSFRTTTVSGQTEDSMAKRYVWNYYNRVERVLRVTESTDSWAYTLATYRPMNNSTSNALDMVVGINEVQLLVRVVGHASNSTGGIQVNVSIGQDSTTAATTGTIGEWGQPSPAGNVQSLSAELRVYPAVGRHVYTALERSIATGTTTWYGDNGDLTALQSGIFGSIPG